MSDLTARIDEKIGEVRTESVDLSFGEIVNLHSANELIIQPDYQRLFRWSEKQRSRLLESILLELPIPQIFVVENEDGVLELIDGLQRVCSVIQFIAPTKLEKLNLAPLCLTGCDIIRELNGNKFDDLPLSLRLRIKRSSVRTVVIKRQSKSFIRYEMFQRLNTGGDILAPQEIRNCSARMIGEDGIRFYGFLQAKAVEECFKTCIEPMSQSDMEKKGDEELVLRFLATKNARESFRGSVRDWLDDYMEQVMFGRVSFDYEAESETFDKLFCYFAQLFGAGSFVRYKDETPAGALVPAYFEALTIGVLKVFDRLQEISGDTIRKTLINLVQSENFKQYTGPSAKSKEKLNNRIRAVQEALEALF